MNKIFLLYFIISSISHAATISGFIYDDKTNKPIQNVNIFIANQNIGTTSKENGAFTLNYNLKDDVILEISHIAYSIKKIPLNNDIKILHITLEEIFFETDNIVVTSTRTKKLHKNVPIATEVITKKDINDSGATNVAELLSSHSGVSLQTSVEGGSILNILGMDSRYILILIDGQPITGKFNGRAALDQISTNQIKKIEIIKGPSSSLYGSEAMAGVVNIITNNQTKNKSLNFHGQYGISEHNLSSEGLGYGSSNLKLSGSKNINKLNLLLNAEIENLKTDKAVQQINIDDVHKQSLLANLSWAVHPNHKINIREMLYDHKENGSSQLMNTDTYIMRNNFSISHDWSFHNHFSLSHSLQHQIYKREYLQTRPWNGDIVTDNLTSESNYEYEGILHKEIITGEINGGLEISQSFYKSDRVENGKQIISTNSFFCQLDKYVTKKLNLVMGTRFDKYTGYDIVISPRFGLMYLPNEFWKFRTTWGKGFRAPSFMERFIDWNHVQFGYQVIGNPNLKPERSEGYTAGIEYNLHANYQASLMIYYNKFKNLIQDYAIEPSLLSYQNINQAEYKGIEVQNRWKISNTWISTWGLNLIDNRDGDGNMISNTQPFSSYLRFSHQHPQLKYNFSMNIKWVGAFTPTEYDPESGTYINSEKISDYFIIDANCKLRFKSIMDLKIGIKNLGNHTNNKIGPFIGRFFYVQIIKTII